MTQNVIQVEGLSKRFRVGERERYLALRDLIARALRAPVQLLARRQNRTASPGGDFLWAIKDVSFRIREGEVVGLIGRNGAGKSTLLKILARITTPTRGFAEIRGRVGSLLEVGTGFHPELTGRENVFLCGAVLGMKRQEIARKFDEILDFAGVERFIDTPLKYFSTGMQMRLAFAVAAHLEPEILVVDEVLAVGDMEFQKKCLGKMEQVSKGGRTIVFVSHQMTQIRLLCERVIWIDQGKIRKDGATTDVIAAYQNSAAEFAAQALTLEDDTVREVRFLLWELLNEGQDSAHILRHMGPITFRVLAKLREPIHKGLYAILLADDLGRTVWHTTCALYNVEAGLFEFIHKLPALPLLPNAYHWETSIYNGHRWSEPWQGLPPLIVGTKPLTRANDSFASLLNIGCEIEMRSLDPNKGPSHEPK